MEAHPSANVFVEGGAGMYVSTVYRVVQLGRYSLREKANKRWRAENVSFGSSGFQYHRTLHVGAGAVVAGFR